MRPCRILASLLLLASAVTGAVAQAPHKNACKLITPEEASALAGAPIKPLVPDSAACMLTSRDMSSSITAMVLSFPDAKTAAAGFDRAYAARQPNPPGEAVSGLGERACFATVNSDDYNLMVLVKADIITLLLPHHEGPLTPAKKAAMVDTMKKMLSRL